MAEITRSGDSCDPKVNTMRPKIPATLGSAEPNTVKTGNENVSLIIMDTFGSVLGVAWGSTLKMVGMATWDVGVTAATQLIPMNDDTWIIRMSSSIKHLRL